MMPLKIEISENAGSGYDVMMLGIGETGRKAIREYPSLYVPIPFKKERGFFSISILAVFNQ